MSQGDNKIPINKMRPGNNFALGFISIDGRRYLYKSYKTIDKLVNAILFDDKFKAIEKLEVLAIQLIDEENENESDN